MIPLLTLPSDAMRVEALLARVRLNPADIALARGPLAAAAEGVRQILADVADRGDAAIVEASRRFDDPDFTADQIRVTAAEMGEAAARLPAEQMSAIRRAIAQVREYQEHILPASRPPLERATAEGAPAVTLGLRFTPLDSAGVYFPGGKASYPSSLIHLAVPAQVAGVGRIAVCTPPSRFGRSDLVLAACHELRLTEVFRAGGAAAVGALAFGTRTIAAVDKIVGPGNTYVQLAKRLVAGAVGIDGYLGPSDILVIADDSARPDFVAADLIAQAEHDPGICFLLTTSPAVANAVRDELARQTAPRQRRAAIEKALADESAIIVDESMERLIALANRFAPEHVNLQTRDDAAVLRGLHHAGAVFVGPYSPVAAGDYLAGPSHCLPTNTTARFSSGISVYEFLKRGSVVQYTAAGLRADAPALVALANAEHLDGHAASAEIRAD